MDVGNPFVLFSHFYMQCILVSVLFITSSSILVSVLFIVLSSLLPLDFVEFFFITSHYLTDQDFTGSLPPHPVNPRIMGGPRPGMVVPGALPGSMMGPAHPGSGSKSLQ